MSDDFGKIRDGGKLRQESVEQRQSVLPDPSVLRIYQYFVKKQIDLRPQPRDGLLDRLAHDPFILLVQFALRTSLEQRLIDRPAARKLRLLEDVADALEARPERLEIGSRP